MSKWLDWYNTPEGKAYYDKYISNIPGIEADESAIKNAYYEWVNSVYETEDSIKESINNTFNFFKWSSLIIVAFFIYLNRSELENSLKIKKQKNRRNKR